MKCWRWFVIMLPRVKWDHPHVYMTLLSKDIPLIFFNGSLWNLLLGCSKWLLGHGLIASQWSWESDWLSEQNEPNPLSVWHCDPELCLIQYNTACCLTYARSFVEFILNLSLYSYSHNITFLFFTRLLNLLHSITKRNDLLLVIYQRNHLVSAIAR